MKQNIYAIRDSVADQFNTPFFMQSDALASRAFLNLRNDKQSGVALNPSDYTLFFIGSYDTDTGYITPVDPVVVPVDKGE